jgi:hypothetical protein
LAVAVLAYGVALLLGFALVREGLSTWDTRWHRQQMEWLVAKWSGRTVQPPFEAIKWYGPLYEYVLALATAVLRSLRDPTCVRHAVTFTLLPLTLVAVYALLRRSGETRGTAALAAALLAGNVRFDGHALLNVKDFPFACGYLLATLVLWLLWSRRLSPAARFVERPGTVLLATVVSVVPYLMRAPVMAHWCVLVALGVSAAAVSKEAPALRRWSVGLLPLVAGPLVAWAVWPALWETGPAGFLQSFTFFSAFTWEGQVRLFGRTFSATGLPWWYGPAWIPVSWEPVGLLTLVAGSVPFVLLAVRGLRSAFAPGGSLAASLPLWVAVFAAAPWAAVLVLRPVLYDEDRHVLFAMPLLAVAAALGLRRLPEPAKAGLAAAVAVSALAAGVQWGKYAYVYKDPLLPRVDAEDFMGDYWCAASGAMAQALYDRVPDGSWVVVIAPVDVFVDELDRRVTSRLVAAPTPKSFRLEDRGPPSGPFYVLATNRNHANARIAEDIAQGRAREVWSERMPSSRTPAAVLAYYTEPCPHCRYRPKVFYAG